MEKKVISVIIPTFNRAKILKKTLFSYLNQKNIKELIIVDDGSTENDRNILINLMKKEKKIVYIRNSSNKGLPASRNIGIRKSKGDYVFFGEDDVELSKNHLVELLKHLQDNHADIIAGRRIWMRKGESKKQALKRANRIKSPPINYKLILTNCAVKLAKDTELPLLDASMLIKKKVLEKVTYDENYKNNFWREETDFQLSAIEKGFKLIYCPHAACYHLFKKEDKSGCHTSNGFMREYFIFKNNYYFAKKHYKLIKDNFGIKSFYFYIVNFTLHRIIFNLMIHYLSRIKNIFFK